MVSMYDQYDKFLAKSESVILREDLELDLTRGETLTGTLQLN